jgi:lysophospholipase L1-like esterase
MRSSSGRRWRALAAALIASSATACGDNPTRPTPGNALAITCPPSVTVQSPEATAVAVQFAAPTVTGGTAPVTTTCTHQSGSPFEVGTTDVACTARDARQQAASCGFRVAVAVPPKLATTRFLAFGDSITAGVIPTTCSLGTPPVSRCLTTLTPLTLAQLLPSTPAERLLDIQQLRADLNASSVSYPLKLQALLASRYYVQPVVVVNEGLPGETADDGVDRLSQALTTHAPEALLLMEGINDIHRPGNQAASVGPLVQSLRTMTRQARSRGVRVFLGTLLPEDRCGCRAFDFVDGRDDIARANDQIRAMAAAEGAVLVDLHQAFAGQTATLLTFDGLHPNAAGYEKMAETFFDAIRQQLEILH